jgi:hypothetical protein
MYLKFSHTLHRGRNYRQERSVKKFRETAALCMYWSDGHTWEFKLGNDCDAYVHT